MWRKNIGVITGGKLQIFTQQKLVTRTYDFGPPQLTYLSKGFPFFDVLYLRLWAFLTFFFTLSFSVLAPSNSIQPPFTLSSNPKRKPILRWLSQNRVTGPAWVVLVIVTKSEVAAIVVAAVKFKSDKREISEM